MGEKMRIEELVDSDSWRGAYNRLASAEQFPEITARLRMVSSAVGPEAQRALAVMERAFAEGWVQPRPPEVRSGRTVAVVGGGMVGLAASAALNRTGHHVRVYESSHQLGGLMCVGHRHVKVEQWVVDRRVQLLEAEGVEFVTNALIGQSLGFDELRRVSDALLLSIGHRRPRRLLAPGSELPGVVRADQLFRARVPLPDVAGRQVLILGDRDGAERAYTYVQNTGAAGVCVLPLVGGALQAQLDREAEGAWPLVYPHEAEISFPFSSLEALTTSEIVSVLAVEQTPDRRCLVRFVRVDVGPEPYSGSTVVPRPGSAFSLVADLVVVAAGYVGPETRFIEEQLGVELDVYGNVAADRRFGTTVSGVFYAGDANPGASSLLWDLSQGLDAAAVIDARLGGTTQSS